MDWSGPGKKQTSHSGTKRKSADHVPLANKKVNTKPSPPKPVPPKPVSPPPTLENLVHEVVNYYEKIIQSKETQFDKKYVLLHIHPDKVLASFKITHADEIRKKHTRLVSFINNIFKEVYPNVSSGNKVTKDELRKIIVKHMK
jgi:hypothetical protein